MTGPANSWSEQLDPGRPFEDASQKMERTIMEADNLARPKELPRYRVMSYQHRGERRAYYVRDDWESSWKYEHRIGDIGTDKRKAERLCRELNAVHSPACGDRGVT